MAERPLLVKIHVGRKCISIPSKYALIGKTGLFVREVQLLAPQWWSNFVEGETRCVYPGSCTHTMRTSGPLWNSEK